MDETCSSPKTKAGHVRLLRDSMPAPTWIETVQASAPDEAACDAIRRNTQAGRPLGSDTFLAKLEALIGRRLRPLPIGRQQGWRKARTAPPEQE